MSDSTSSHGSSSHPAPRNPNPRAGRVGAEVRNRRGQEGALARRPASASRRRVRALNAGQRFAGPEQPGRFSRAAGRLRQGARAAYEQGAEAPKPSDVYIQQNYDLFREADDKRNRKSQEEARGRHSLGRCRSPWSHADPGLRLLRGGAGGYPPPVASSTCLASAVCSSRASPPTSSTADVDVASETSRLLQNQLRNGARSCRCMEPDRPAPPGGPREGPRGHAWLESRAGRATQQAGAGPVQARDRPAFSRTRISGARIGEEYQNPLIITGKLGFEIAE